MSAANFYTNLDCKTCRPDQKQLRGCEKPSPVKWWTDIHGEPRDRCPRRPILEDINWYNRLISAYNAYKAGFLPHKGGMIDQAALFPEIMGLIDYVVSKCDEAKNARGPAKDGAIRLGM